MPPRVIGVIQGRMGSSRLPGKLLAPLAGRPMLSVIAARARGSRVDEWWLATSRDPSDDVAAMWARTLGLRVFRGDRDDVLSRFAAIIDLRRPDWILRLTGDNPFVDADIVDRLIAAVVTDPGVDHVGEGEERSLPLGYVPEIARAAAVSELASSALPQHHRAHVTSAIRESGRSVALPMPVDWPARPWWRWTVDTEADHRMAAAAFHQLADRWGTADYPTLVHVLDQHPEIAEANATVQQKAEEDG